MEKITSDIGKFGHRERGMLIELLQAWNNNGLPEGFSGDDVKPVLNFGSGNVFLTNSDFQVAMMLDDKLLQFFSCPKCGSEGFAEWLLDEISGLDCCREYLNEVNHG